MFLLFPKKIKNAPITFEDIPSLAVMFARIGRKEILRMFVYYLPKKV